MNKETLYVVKIGGNVVDDPAALQQFLADFAAIKSAKLLVHGGGKIATRLAEQLGLEVNIVNGRRITNAAMLDVTVMVYAGLTNKTIVAQLQALQCNAMGLCGADANIIGARKRQNTDIDFGFVGDVQYVNIKPMQSLIRSGLTPVFAPITHNGEGQLLNTNADTIAATLAAGLANKYKVRLLYCFEKQGVLMDVEDENSVITYIDAEKYEELKQQGVIAKGMLPKLENAFAALNSGVKKVIIGHSAQLAQLTQQNQHAGTIITK